MRVHDWPERLALAVEAERQASFQWGVHDCCLFAADVVLAITGTDHAAIFRGRYDSEHGAMRLIAGHGSIEALITGLLGPAAHPSRAGRGDVVLADLALGPTLGICLGNECAFKAPEGLLFQPRAVAHLAWKV